MKNPLLIFLFVLFCFSVSAQYAEKSNRCRVDQYMALNSRPNIVSNYYFVSKRPPGETMQKVGRALTLSGGVLLVAGIIVTANVDFNNLVDKDGMVNYTNEGQLIIGLVFIEGGIGMLIPGIIFWSRGSKKLERYKQEQNLSLGVKGNGLSLRLKI